MGEYRTHGGPEPKKPMAKEVAKVEELGRAIFGKASLAQRIYNGDKIPPDLYREAIQQKVGGVGFDPEQLRALAAFHLFKEAMSELGEMRAQLLRLREHVGFIADQFPEVREDGDTYYAPPNREE